jgi:hypothetical protein
MKARNKRMENDLYTSSDTSRMIESRSTRLTRLLARMGALITGDNILVGRPVNVWEKNIEIYLNRESEGLS